MHATKSQVSTAATARIEEWLNWCDPGGGARLALRSALRDVATYRFRSIARIANKSFVSEVGILTWAGPACRIPGGDEAGRVVQPWRSMHVCCYRSAR